MTTRPANSARKPSRTTRRGDASGKSLGMPAAARMSVIESGSSRTPVSIAESPSATERNSGTAKKSPPCRKYWKKNEVRPPRSSGMRRILGSTSGSAPRASRRFSHPMKSHSTTPPPSISQMHGDRPSHSGASGLGWTNPHVPARRTPNTMSPRPSADSAVPTRSSRTPASRVPSSIRRARSEDPEHDHHLAREHVAPREVGREQTADDRTDRDRDRGGGGDQPIRARSLRASEVGRHERDDRGQDQRRPEALEARPPDQQHAEVRRDRGDERPARRRRCSRSRTRACGR